MTDSYSLLAEPLFATPLLASQRPRHPHHQQPLPRHRGGLVSQVSQVSQAKWHFYLLPKNSLHHCFRFSIRNGILPVTPVTLAFEAVKHGEKVSQANSVCL